MAVSEALRDRAEKRKLWAERENDKVSTRTIGGRRGEWWFYGVFAIARDIGVMRGLFRTILIVKISPV